MTRLEEMVIAAIPTARPGVDFSFETDENGHAFLSHWDSLKLGEKPPLPILHAHFMKYLANKKKIIPTIDMTDPCPWLNEPEFEIETASKKSNIIENEENKYAITPGGTILRYRGNYG